MKKAYVKPAMCVESFKLSQSIAVSCGFDKDNSTIGRPLYGDIACGWERPRGDVIWTAGAQNCQTILDENVDINGSCYNAPMAANQIFAS